MNIRFNKFVVYNQLCNGVDFLQAPDANIYLKQRASN